jgi:stage IV sporulation protein FB
MLVEPGTTPYDLRFRLFGTSVRVHPLFWLFSAILGWDFLNYGFIYLGLWVASCFVSILLHEFGHVWAGRAFGSHGSIVLYAMGGLAIGASDLHDRWKRIVVYLAGPFIQLLFIYLPVWLWFRSLGVGGLHELRIQVLVTALILMDINLYWPLLNLLPIWPLDGGKVSRECCTALSPAAGLKTSLGISIAFAGLLAVNSIVAETKGQGFLPYVSAGGDQGKCQREGDQPTAGGHGTPPQVLTGGLSPLPRVRVALPRQAVVDRRLIGPHLLEQLPALQGEQAEEKGHIPAARGNVRQKPLSLRFGDNGVDGQ